jgi:NAD(P)-dependent dehydrogenase (short-subunit alcohol dehydrogenase family)
VSSVGGAVITGAASGIGAALAEQLAARGTHVILADIELDRAEACAAAIRATGGKAVATHVDHADRASIDALAAFARATLDSIDLVVANAGVGAGGPLWSTPQRNIDWVFAINLLGPIWVAQAFLPLMIDAGQPCRFAITGSEHSLGLPSRGGQASVYTVSKHAVLGVAETLRRDLAETQVAVSVICPAVVLTDIWNPLRTRHERFGGPRVMERRASTEPGLTPAEAATRILDGFDAGEFYVFTHGNDIAEVHGAQAKEIDSAIARFRARYGADA